MLVDKEQSASDIPSKEQPATSVPDKKQAAMDTSRTALATQIMDNFETLNKEIALIKKEIDLIKLNTNEMANIKRDIEIITKQSSTSSNEKEISNLIIDIENDLKILITNSEKADSMPNIIEELKGLLNTVTTRFENFSNILQELSVKQNAFALRVERVTDFIGVPGIRSTCVNKILKHSKSFITVVSWMLIGVGLLRLAELIWELWKNQI